MGYYEDEFIGRFVPREEQQRRSPLINRGYFARVSAVDAILDRFLATAGEVAQVVSLGSGMDTTFFRLMRHGRVPTKYVELDLPDVATRKRGVIRHHPDMLGFVHGETSRGEIDRLCESGALSLPSEADPDGVVQIKTSRYCLMGADLRSTVSVASALRECDLSWDAPTLFLSECVLVYLDPEHSDALLEWIPRQFRQAVAVSYEQIRPDDPFGQMMQRNLEARGFALRGLKAHPDPPAQTRRFLRCGWDKCTVLDMNQVYDKFLRREDVARVARLEMLDEVEEWHLIQAHYCIAVAVHCTTTPEGTSGEAGTWPRGLNVTDTRSVYEKQPSDPELFDVLFPADLFG